MGFGDYLELLLFGWRLLKPCSVCLSFLTSDWWCFDCSYDSLIPCCLNL